MDVIRDGKINLWGFCSELEARGLEINLPYCDGKGFVYASDGAICIRVDKEMFHGHYGSGNFPDIKGMISSLDEYFISEFEEFPDYAKRTRPLELDERWECSSVTDEGLSFTSCLGHVGIDLGDFTTTDRQLKIKERYLWIINELPNSTYRIVTPTELQKSTFFSDSYHDGCMLFKFAGGRGICMPYAR